MTEHALPRRRTRLAHRGLGKTALVPLIIVAVAIALVIIMRLILDPIATHQTRKALDQLDGFKGDFERVHVTIFGPGYDIMRLKLVRLPVHKKGEPGTKEGSGDPVGEKDRHLKQEPVVYVERAHVGIDWRELLHLRLAANLRLEEPKITIVAPAANKAGPTAPETPKTPDLSEQLQKVTGLRVDRIEVLGGELLFRQPLADGGDTQGEHGEQREKQGQDRSQDRLQDGSSELWVHRLELVAQNLTTRRSLTKGRPATMSAHGTLGRSGDLTMFVSADPLASPLSFAGQASVTGFRAAELYDFVAPKTKMQIPQGTIDVFAEFVSKKGIVTGGIKPVLKNLEIRPTESGLWDRLKAWLADTSVEVASDRISGRNAVATTIPIKGRLVSPDIQLWPAVLGVIRNAFVEGLASGFSNVPPPTSDQKEGVLTQVKNALTKEEGPPKAQPVDVKAAAGK